MDVGYRFILLDIDTYTEPNELFEKIIYYEYSTREKYIIFYSILFFLSTLCGIFLCMLRETTKTVRQSTNNREYKIVSSDLA